MGKLLIAVIISYQSFLSPIFKVWGVANCRFNPTCSQYLLLAIRKYGSIKGSILGIKRFLRCQPFSGFGYDPIS